MSPKKSGDIRSFFTKPSTKPAGDAKAASAKASPAAEQAVSAHGSPAKGGSGSGSGAGGASGSGVAARKAVIIDDSDDDDCMLVDSDDAKQAAAVPASANKRARDSSAGEPAASPAKPAKRATPASFAAKAADAQGSTPAETKAKTTVDKKEKGVKAAPKTPKPKPGSGSPVLDANAKAAIAAVDAAVAKLPEQAKFSVLEEGADGAVNEALDPPNHGTKDVPRGHPDCLSGKTFVISGVLDSLFRDAADDLIKRHGGRTTGAVSGKTSFLLTGMNCGRSKMRTALEKKTKVIDEDGLFSLIAASSHLAPPPAPAAPVALAFGSPAKFAATSGGAGTSGSAPAAAPPTSLGAGAFFGSGGAGGSGSSAAARPSARPPAPMAPPERPPRPSGVPASSLLWVDKHKPRNSQELAGNNTLVATLRAWLNQWHDIHIRKQEPKGYPGSGSGKPKDMHKKAVLLSGPPGIGKTSAAHIIARECGFAVVEMNASDTRNKSDTKIKDGIHGKGANMIKEMVGNETIFSSLAKASNQDSVHKQILVMDEVDGMSGGDRGGVQDLMDTIKRSKIPIVCICNDKWNQKLKSLRNHCLEMDFRRPTPQQIGKRMQEICAQEGLHVNEATMNALVEGANGDLRLILGQLQMVRLSRTTLSYDDVKNGAQRAAKDADRSPFECAAQLFQPASQQLSMNDRLDMVFADADLVPLLVQENYINHKPMIAGNDEQRMRAIAKSAEAISAGDKISTALRKTNNWSLGPAAYIQMAVVPATYMRGGREIFNPGEMNFPRFTAWLGNFSTSNKQRRLLGEITTTMGASGHMPSHRSVVRSEYLPALRHLLSLPLARAEASAAPTDEIGVALKLMDDYGVSREQFDYVMDVTRFKTKQAWGEDPMKNVSTKIKSAFTRTFNQADHAARCSLQLEAPKKGRAKKPAGGPALEELEIGDLQEGEDIKGEDEEEEEGEEGEDGLGFDDGSAEAMKKKLAKKGVTLSVKDDGNKKGKAAAPKAAASGSGAGRGGGRGGAAGGRGRGKK